MKLIGGSADLYGSTLNYIGDLKTGDDDFTPGHRAGRNIRFGIREHGMAAIANGIAYDGVFRPSIATFLVFADYSRPDCRPTTLTYSRTAAGFTNSFAATRSPSPPSTSFSPPEFSDFLLE